MLIHSFTPCYWLKGKVCPGLAEKPRGVQQRAVVLDGATSVRSSPRYLLGILCQCCLAEDSIRVAEVSVPQPKLDIHPCRNGCPKSRTVSTRGADEIRAVRVREYLEAPSFLDIGPAQDFRVRGFWETYRAMLSGEDWFGNLQFAVVDHVVRFRIHREREWLEVHAVRECDQTSELVATVDKYRIQWFIRQPTVDALPWLQNALAEKRHEFRWPT